VRAAARAGALTVAFVLAVPFSAPAGNAFESRVSIKVEYPEKGNPAALSGRVRSSKAACERQRKVKVIRRDQGETTVFGRDLTDGQGRWRVVPAGPVPNGTYHAVAVRKRIDAGRCAKARSESVFVD
jgi:ssDNA-binding replication factor A large subunit